MSVSAKRMTSTHWGVYWVRAEGERVVGVEPFECDPMPSTIGYSNRSIIGRGRES